MTTLMCRVQASYTPACHRLTFAGCLAGRRGGLSFAQEMQASEPWCQRPSWAAISAEASLKPCSSLRTQLALQSARSRPSLLQVAPQPGQAAPSWPGCQTCSQSFQLCPMSFDSDCRAARQSGDVWVSALSQNWPCSVSVGVCLHASARKGQHGGCCRLLCVPVSSDGSLSLLLQTKAALQILRQAFFAASNSKMSIVPRESANAQKLKALKFKGS